MFTFCRLTLVVTIAGLAYGCERASPAPTGLDAGVQTASQGPAASASGEVSDQTVRTILGAGDAGFVPKFLSSNTIGNSAIFERDGKFVTIGGTGNTCCSLQVDGGFPGQGTIVNVQQLDPAGDIKVDFAQAGFGALGDIGVTRGGGPERFTILSTGRNPRNLALTLVEDGGKVGIGTRDPSANLDVVGSARVRGDLTVFDGRVHLGGTATPAGRLQVSDNFSGFGPSHIIQVHNIDPTGDITVDFASSPIGVLGNMGVIRSRGGRPDRFVILGNGRSPTSLPLTLREDGGNVGIGTADPKRTLDVNGDGRFSGNVAVAGDLAVTGTKSSVATLSDGRRVLLYAIESPQNWFEDFGTAELRDGKAWVSLEGVFAETVNTGASYHVFLTPNGDCKGLYVAERRPDGFLVRELGRGKSTVGFDYRIVAPRRGFETVRLHELP